MTDGVRMLLLIDHGIDSKLMNGDEWKSLPETAAIYMLVNEINDKIYVGRSVNIRGRIRSHYRHDFEKYNGKKLSNAKIKYGVASFKFRIIEWCSTDVVLEREEFYLKELKPFGDNGYNIRDVADSSTGSFIMSDDQKKTISESLKEYHTKNENAFKGKMHSAESRELIKRNLRGEDGVLKSAKTMQSDEYREMKREQSIENNTIDNVRKWIEENGPARKTSVVMLDPLTKEPIREFTTVKEAAEFFDKPRGTNISNCLAGRSTKAYGYYWVKK